MQNNILKWSFIIGLVILLNIFINYAISVAYPQPKFENFCTDKTMAKIINDQATCEQEKGLWTNQSTEYAYPAPKEGYCNLSYYCQKDFEKAMDEFSQNVFIYLIIASVLLFVISLIAKNNAVINVGFAWAGVLSLIIASFRIWPYSSDWVKLLIVGIALAVLIYFAYKKFTLPKDSSNN